LNASLARQEARDVIELRQMQKPIYQRECPLVLQQASQHTGKVDGREGNRPPLIRHLRSMLRKKREAVKYFLRIFLKVAFLRNEKIGLDHHQGEKDCAKALISCWFERNQLTQACCHSAAAGPVI
jgi:hypothetical protein